MEHSDVVRQTRTFNSNNLAAQHLVRTVMMEHFLETEELDVVVLAGYGRFGQTVLEELQIFAARELSEIVIIDTDAHRRVLVAEEQVEIPSSIEKHVLQGDISHPEVWQRVEDLIDLSVGEPLVLMVTGRDDENLRSGIWLSKRHPNARVMIRSQRASHFAESVGKSSGILTFSLSQVFQESLPDEWFVNAPE